MAALGGIFAPISAPEFSKPAPVSFLGIMAGFGAFSVLFFDAFLNRRSPSEQRSKSGIWIPVNPAAAIINGRVGLGFAAYSAGAALAGLTLEKQSWFFELPGALGIGMLLAAWALTKFPVTTKTPV